jgi:hypothetical protein
MRPRGRQQRDDGVRRAAEPAGDLVPGRDLTGVDPEQRRGGEVRRVQLVVEAVAIFTESSAI